MKRMETITIAGYHRHPGTRAKTGAHAGDRGEPGCRDSAGTSAAVNIMSRARGGGGNARAAKREMDTESTGRLAGQCT